MSSLPQYTVVVPAAGIGQRMQADRPKQYLTIAGKTILEHTLNNLYAHPQIKQVIVALSPEDEYFSRLPLANQPWVKRVHGGSERADSVLAGLDSIQDEDWVLVHDAARPCLAHDDLSKLLAIATHSPHGAILACRARDTMKRGSSSQAILHTECRDNLWHALTPQFFPLKLLRSALTSALKQKVQITDEASAIEWAQGKVHLVEGRSSNIKVTQPEDLQLAEFYLQHKVAL
ncbi:2-C-methyl-D-erythritol 4-phosphate cytidylyltransferase [Paraglaciecola chathamensis]|uniref:2-C-methyl-D-erythritol 4-phosphate cytidylyltransferase n=1 Tax=Paraglaciecola chathamensis TaxID=368405 RepID=UPI0026FA15CA|nr:2-C-methyl-D-erythritol 4-phosphate cytidylyltransferase [Paraglaciecola chathamensis]MDO6559689.1 2-C-methyl-D-erythritol 4-phosphate cytidylyltransferase [Paraglaciecola chathamensis]